MADTGLGGKVNDYLRFIPVEKIVSCRTIGLVRFGEYETGLLSQQGKVRLLQGNIVI
jgi:hypothetical protein